MNQLDKKKFELTVEVVQNTIRGLCLLYDEFGIVGMNELTNPSLDQLKKIISKMKDETSKLESSLAEKEDSLDNESALIVVNNVKQGLLFTELLISGIEKEDPEYCQRVHNDIKNNEIFVPGWSTESNS